MIPENTPLQTTEHRAINFSDEHKKWLSGRLNKKKPELLGLHKTTSGIAPGNFIGTVWIGGENKTPLIVGSKFPQMDYMSMYLTCAEDSIIGSHLKKCFHFWPEEPPIEAEDLPKLSELLIAAFLRELNELCTRHLRRHFERETKNLRNKVKGKILLHLQAGQNLAHGREDRVFCSYQTIHDDIPENRVLRAALEQSAKFINSRPDPPLLLHHWIHASRSALSGVSVVEVKRSDFRNLRVRGAFAHYGRAIEIAKFVLLRLGTNPHAEVKENISTPPFAIDSAELFERYAEKMLRQEYPGLVAGYDSAAKNTPGDKGGFNAKVRPDFWIKKDSMEIARIIDAKYKSNEEIKNEGQDEDATETGFKPSRQDIFQMISYSRHQNLVGKKLNSNSDGKIELALAYPNFEQMEKIKKIKTDNSFFAPLTILFLKCPAKEERDKLQNVA